MLVLLGDDEWQLDDEGGRAAALTPWLKRGACAPHLGHFVFKRKPDSRQAPRSRRQDLGVRRRALLKISRMTTAFQLPPKTQEARTIAHTATRVISFQLPPPITGGKNGSVSQPPPPGF
jgi:hypothetical protein